MEDGGTSKSKSSQPKSTTTSACTNTCLFLERAADPLQGEERRLQLGGPVRGRAEVLLPVQQRPRVRPAPERGRRQPPLRDGARFN